MEHWVYTEAGYNHLNEDKVVVQPHPQNSDVLLCVLADGQGGRSGGAAAAHIAVEKCLEAASSFSVKKLMEPASWYLVLSAADEAVCEDAEAGLTTLISLCVTEDRVCGASCGDSAAQLIRNSQSLLLTEDQRKNPPVGSGAAYPIAFQASLSSEWTLLIMSDGVWRYVGYDAIGEMSAHKAGQVLISGVRQMQLEQNGGTLGDDFSIILLQKAGFRAA